MKQILSIALLSFYTLFAVGVNVHMHFCSGKLKDVSFFSEADLCCSEEADGSCSFHTNCCEDKDFRIALEDEHQPTLGSSEFDSNKFFLPSVTQLIIGDSGWCSAASGPIRAGPPTSSPPIYIQLCRLTYYG